MTAYTVIDMDVIDPTAMQAYEAGMAELLPQFGASLLARETEAATLDGTWAPQFFVLLAFPDKDAIVRFYDSVEYAPLKAIRQKAARSQVLAVAGFDQGAVA